MTVLISHIAIDMRIKRVHDSDSVILKLIYKLDTRGVFDYARIVIST